MRTRCAKIEKLGGNICIKSRSTVTSLLLCLAHLPAMSDDGHLYLSARGGVEYTGDSRHAWYDDAHHSVLVLSPRSGKLRQIALDTTLDAQDRDRRHNHSDRSARRGAQRSYVAGTGHRFDDDADDDDDDGGYSDDSADKENASQAHCGVSMLYDFTPSQVHRIGAGGAYQVVGNAHGDAKLEKDPVDPVALMKLSLDKQYVAMQTSDIEVQVIRIATREKFWIMCKPNSGNRILNDGLMWNTHSSAPGSSQDLFLITKMGIEHYRVSAKRRSCVLHRAIGVYIHTFWYAASHGVLIISTGSRANEIIPYLLHGSSVEKLPRLVFSAPVSRNDLYLAPLYGQLYAVYGDTRSTKLLLYLVERNKVSCVRSLNLMLPPGTPLEYSVVDNLLVCHSLDFNVSLFFDIKCDGSVSNPFSHPLPISLRAPARSPACSPGVFLSSQSSSSSEDLPTHDSEDDRTCGAATGRPSYEPFNHLIRRARSVDDMNGHASLNEDFLEIPVDVEGETKTEEGSPSATLSPPLKRKPAVKKLERAMTTMNLGKMDYHQFESDGHYFSQWRFLSPNLVQRSFTVKGRKDLMEQVEVRKLQVNLRGIARSCARHKDVLPFLLRRGDQALSKALVLKLVLDTLQEQELTISGVVGLFSTVQTITAHEVDREADESPNDTSSDDESSVRSMSTTTSTHSSSFHDLTPHLIHSASFRTRTFAEGRVANAMPYTASPARNLHGFLLVYQSEFYQHVWDVLLPDSTVRVVPCFCCC